MKKNLCRFFAGLTLILPTALAAADFTMLWDPNTESDITRYRIFQAEASLLTKTPQQALADATVLKHPLVSHPAIEFTATNLTPGKTYFFRMTALDEAGNESWFNVDGTGNPAELVKLIPGASGNQLPTARAGNDQTLTDVDNNGSESVTLDGSASTDPEGPLASFQWLNGTTVLGTTARITVTLPRGTHTLTLRVTDSQGATASDTMIVTINAPAPQSLNVYHMATSASNGSHLYVKDKKLSTVWTVSGKILSAWVRLDLGAPKTVSEIRFYNSATGKAANADLEYSVDGVSWTPFVAQGQTLRGVNLGVTWSWNSRDVNDVSGVRYVRFLIRSPDPTGQAWVQLGSFAEIEIKGPDQAQMAPGALADAASRPVEKFLSPGIADGINDAAYFEPDVQEVMIFDANGRRVYQSSTADGNFILSWNCHNDRGEIVPSGLFVAQMKRTDGKVSYRSLAVVK